MNKQNHAIVMCLRAIARSENAKLAKHDVIFDGAADEIERLDEIATLQGKEISITRERDEALEGALLEIAHLPDHADLHEAVLIAIRALPEDLRVDVSRSGSSGDV